MNSVFRLFTALLGAVLILVVPSAQAQDEPPLEGWMAQFILNEPPLPAPSTEFRTAAGDKLTLASFKGKVILVNFWATWCAPCVREMPALDRLQAAMDRESFEIVAVSEDRAGPEKALPFLEKLGIQNFSSYFDHQMALARALKLRGMPTTYLIDGEGRVVGSLAGIAEWDSPESIALMRYYVSRL